MSLLPPAPPSFLLPPITFPQFPPEKSLFPQFLALIVDWLEGEKGGRICTKSCQHLRDRQHPLATPSSIHPEWTKLLPHVVPPIKSSFFLCFQGIIMGWEWDFDRQARPPWGGRLFVCYQQQDIRFITKKIYWKATFCEVGWQNNWGGLRVWGCRPETSMCHPRRRQQTSFLLVGKFFSLSCHYSSIFSGKQTWLVLHQNLSPCWMLWHSKDALPSLSNFLIRWSTYGHMCVCVNLKKRWLDGPHKTRREKKNRDCISRLRSITRIHWQQKKLFRKVLDAEQMFQDLKCPPWETDFKISLIDSLLNCKTALVHVWELLGVWVGADAVMPP